MPKEILTRKPPTCSSDAGRSRPAPARIGIESTLLRNLSCIHTSSSFSFWSMICSELCRFLSQHQRKVVQSLAPITEGTARPWRARAWKWQQIWIKEPWEISKYIHISSFFFYQGITSPDLHKFPTQNERNISQNRSLLYGSCNSSNEQFSNIPTRRNQNCM